jgi:hypothetical protein
MRSTHSHDLLASVAFKHLTDKMKGALVIVLNVKIYRMRDASPGLKVLLLVWWWIKVLLDNMVLFFI